MENRPHVFIVYAYEDKPLIVARLVTELRRWGLRVWYDDFSLRVGDSIGRGLSSAAYGVVVLTTAFSPKGGPRRN